ncbi:Acetyltransferase (GNAT) family protein [Nakamurella panacisegetis]|uniref:Acetyltransferase (GNAT) family protein n=1 Tax=Nakamurella panacisegetis TaxID=1090615 RepID=A0A1H0L3J9_9ACTN|nr:GNAT family N-acetyltransferase [Nakamurella panacisegetis]SDO62799.1 Acetyltransferase (GNAT) family protein [Nakamurella panacisegetis]
MTRALVPLTMSSIGDLPEKCRSCVTWELPPDAAAGMDPDLAGFEKEVWLSGVMLTWGSAGQIVTVDGQPAGFALYAPPTAVPGASAFPTAPVSPDAVLLTTARIHPEFRGQGLARYLMNGVVTTLTRRGVRAIELFGVEAGDPADDERSPGRRDGHGDVEVPKCVLPADFARAVGFADVQAHHRYPRLRFELSSGIGWKAEVESALEKLFSVITIPAPPVAQPALVNASAEPRPSSSRPTRPTPG